MNKKTHTQRKISKQKSKASRSKTKAKSVSKPSRSGGMAASNPDAPNKPKLIVTIDGVSGNGGSKMSFGVSALGEYKHFGAGTPTRVLYEGDYVPGPIVINVDAWEAPPSDDTFSSGTATLNLDMKTFQATGEAIVTMNPDPSDDDKDKDDDKGGGDNESASYTISFSARLEAALEITSIDVVKNEIVFDLLPEGVGSGSLMVVVTSKAQGGDKKRPDVKWIVPQQIKGGKGQKVQLDWKKFDDNPKNGAFHAQSISLYWNNLSFMAEDTYDNADFTGYGVFRISRYVTPNDDWWNGPTEEATFGKTKRIVHTKWISRVRCEEGRGVSQGDIVDIEGPGTPNPDNTVWIHKSGTQRLAIKNEGGYKVKRLTVDKSLARHGSDTRFDGHDRILLSTDPGKVFEIEDTGNWSQAKEPIGRRVIDHFDRYFGFASPTTAKGDFTWAYVVKLPKN